MLPSRAASAGQQEVPKAQREPAVRRAPTSSAAPAPALELQRRGETAPHPQAVPIALRVSIAADREPRAEDSTSAPASTKADRHVPEAAASVATSRFQPSPLETAHPAPAKAPTVRASVRQQAPDRNPVHQDSARAVPAVRRAMASGRSAALAVAKGQVPPVPTAPSASRGVIVIQIVLHPAHAALRVVARVGQAAQPAQAASVVRVATVSRARPLVAVTLARPSEQGSRARKAIAPSSGRMHLRVIVHPDANPRAATESPAVATVPGASSRPGPGLRAAALLHVLKVARGSRGPSALRASAPADSASPRAAPVAASESPASANPALADPARANPAAIANPQATGRQPAGIVQSVRVPRALPSLQGSVLLVRQQAGTPLQAPANPAASASPAVSASPSANHAPQEQVRVGRVQQEQGRVAPPPQQAPASHAVPVDLTSPEHPANRAHPVARPPREASATSSHAPSHPVANVQPRNVLAASQRPNANRARKGIKARADLPYMCPKPVQKTRLFRQEKPLRENMQEARIMGNAL